MLALLVGGLLLVLAVFVVAFVRLDRRLHSLAEQRAAAFLAGPFGHPPVVRVHGDRFLGQALRGRYRHIEVTGERLRLGEFVAHDLRATLTGATLSPRELLARRADALPCDRVTGTLVLPYPALARLSRVPGLELDYRAGRLRATASLPVAGVGQLARVHGIASLTLDGAVVRLRVGRLGVAGVTLPLPVLNQLLPTINVAVPLPVLPYGLHVDALTPTAAGVLVHGSADDVVFRA